MAHGSERPPFRTAFETHSVLDPWQDKAQGPRGHNPVARWFLSPCGVYIGQETPLWGSEGREEKEKTAELSRKKMELSYYRHQNCEVSSSVHCLWLASIPDSSPWGQCSVFRGELSGSHWPLQAGPAWRREERVVHPVLSMQGPTLREHTWRTVRNGEEQTGRKQHRGGEGRGDDEGREVMSRGWVREKGFSASSRLYLQIMQTPSLPSHQDVQCPRPFRLHSPHYTPHSQPTLPAAFAWVSM